MFCKRIGFLFLLIAACTMLQAQRKPLPSYQPSRSEMIERYAGMRNRNAILQVNGNKINAKAFNELLASLNSGNKIKVLFTTASGQKEEEITLRKKKGSSFSISPITNPDKLQAGILKS